MTMTMQNRYIEKHNRDHNMRTHGDNHNEVFKKCLEWPSDHVPSDHSVLPERRPGRFTSFQFR